MKKKMMGFLILCGNLWGTMQWSAPLTLSLPEQDATAPTLALNYPSNMALAAWESSDGNHTTIQAAFFNGTSWSSITTLSDSDSDSLQPNAAINNDGHAIVVWRRLVSGTSSIIEATFYNGSSWSAPVSISSEGSSATVSSPSVIISPNEDQAVAVWKTNRGIGVLQSSSFDGASWTPISSFDPSAFPNKDHMAMAGNGAAIVSWISPDIANNIYSSIYTSSWSSPVILDSGGLEATVCMDQTSIKSVVLWSTLNTIQTSIWNGMSWSSPHTLLDTEVFAVDPFIASHPTRSSFAALWRGSAGVQAAIYDSDAWSEILTLNQLGFDPQASFNPSDGSVAVIWALTDRIQFCEFISSESSTPIDISGKSPNSVVGFPNIAIDSLGRALAVWSLSDGTHTLVQAAQGVTE